MDSLFVWMVSLVKLIKILLFYLLLFHFQFQYNFSPLILLNVNGRHWVLGKKLHLARKVSTQIHTTVYCVSSVAERIGVLISYIIQKYLNYLNTRASLQVVIMVSLLIVHEIKWLGSSPTGDNKLCPVVK